MRSAVEVAEAEALAGAAEVGGNNAGPWVEKYLNADHPYKISRRGLPWCVGFYLWCWMQTGPLPFAWTLSAGTLWSRMSRKDKVTGQPLPQMEPGYALFWNYHSDGTDAPSHVNMVHHIGDDGTIYTIGGNEGDEESGAPVRVKPRHTLKCLWGVGRMV